MPGLRSVRWGLALDAATGPAAFFAITFVISLGTLMGVMGT